MTLTNRNAGARGPVGTINSLVPAIPGAGVLERIPELNPANFYHNANTIVPYIERLTAPTLSLRADLQSVCATQSIFPFGCTDGWQERSDRRAGDPHSHRRRVHVHYTTGAGEVGHASYVIDSDRCSRSSSRLRLYHVRSLSEVARRTSAEERGEAGAGALRIES